MKFIDEDSVITAHLGEDENSYYHALNPPICMTSLHTFDTLEAMSEFDQNKKGSFIYGRVSNPTVEILENKIALLEHGKKALCFASGMAAATAAVFSVCSQGDHIICIQTIYGPLKILLEDICAKRLGMSVTFVTGDSVLEIKKAITPKTKLIVLESPSSLVFVLQDLAAVAALAKENRIKTYIDNSYCTPIYQKPLDLGIDLVMHTATKYMAGHSDVLGGALVSNDLELMNGAAAKNRELFGGVIGPFEAWLTIRGLRTLKTRLKAHSETAQKVAKFMEGELHVKKVYYPGLPSHPQYELMKQQQTGNCGLLSFDLDCAPERVPAFVNALKLFKIGVSWGGFESLVTAPYYRKTVENAHSMGAEQTLVRIHCGLEDSEDLIADLANALQQL